MYMYMCIYIYICTHRHGRVRIQEQAISDYHLQNRRMCPEMWDRASVFIGISIGVYPSDNFIFRFIIFFCWLHHTRGPWNSVGIKEIFAHRVSQTIR